MNFNGNTQMMCKTCKCGPMKLVTATDNPNKGYAFNLYLCDNCDAVCKNDVWKKVDTWIDNVNNVKQEPTG